MLKFISALIVTLLLATGCNNQPQYTPAELSMMQPCTQMGYPLGQCYAAYQTAGRPNDYNWLSNVAAFAAGAAVNHWWNRYSAPSYSYDSHYWDTHPRINTSNVTNNYVIQQYDTSKPAGLNIQQPVPEKNTKQLIPNQQVQPLFTPNKIVPNQTAPVQQAQPKTDFKPIMVQPAAAPVANQQTFKPIQVAPAIKQAPAANQSVFKPISVQPKASAPKPSFKPIQVSKSKR